MAREKNHPFQMRVSPEWLDIIDNWRRKQADIPSRAESIRRLVSESLDKSTSAGVPPPAAAPIPMVVPALDLADEIRVQIETYRASRPFLENMDQAIIELIEGGLMRENPCENEIILDDPMLEQVKRFANGLSVAQIVHEMLGYAARAYNARDQERAAIRGLADEGRKT
jgi:hypothetical protein